MYRAFIETKADGEFWNTEAFSAFEGFTEKGYQIVKSHFPCMDNTMTKDDIPFGTVRFVRDFMVRTGIKLPEPLDYPEELKYLLGRDVEQTYIYELDKNFPYFIKPVSHKVFTGFPVGSELDLSYLFSMGIDECNTKIWKSSYVKFESEYRVFVLYDNILDCRRYSGDWKIVPDFNVISDAVKNFKSAPSAYALDFGVTDKGETLLVETNDSYALGSYGLSTHHYCHMIEARWIELTN